MLEHTTSTPNKQELTVIMEQDDSVFTQYLFHRRSSRWESSEDLK